LRFQAEMGLLMAIWLFVSAFSALFIIPAMVYVFRPKFIVGARHGPADSNSPSEMSDQAPAVPVQRVADKIG
jgi:uncharacterized protein